MKVSVASSVLLLRGDIYESLHTECSNGGLQLWFKLKVVMRFECKDSVVGD